MKATLEYKLDLFGTVWWIARCGQKCVAGGESWRVWDMLVDMCGPCEPGNALTEFVVGFWDVMRNAGFAPEARVWT